ncbi:MAG TPA: hypothetical protein PLQ87_02255 [Phycisphaerae bacterium]|nr:hypothetical protein [Phycisphaerae bacterium]
MTFALLPISLDSLTQIAAALGKGGAFSDVAFAEFNRIGHDGDGRLVIQLSGAEPKKVKSQHIVLAGFEGDTFQHTRRVFYAQPWKPGQETTHPDCQSADGVAPDAAAPTPQSQSCKTCMHGNKDAASKCSFRKTLAVYLVNSTPEGAAVLDTSTVFTWDASSLSLFPKMDADSNSAGVFEMVKLMSKTGAFVESVVFEMGFHQGSKAPVLTAVGMLPVEQVTQVIEAAAAPEVKSLLAFNAERAQRPTAQAALPAPTPTAAPAADTARAVALGAATRAAPRPAPPVETPAPAPVPRVEQIHTPEVAADPHAGETDEEREDRLLAEQLEARRAARAAAANQPAVGRLDTPIASTATVRSMPPAVSPPVAPAPATVAPTVTATGRSAAFAAFSAAKK